MRVATGRASWSTSGLRGLAGGAAAEGRAGVAGGGVWFAGRIAASVRESSSSVRCCAASQDSIDARIDVTADSPNSRAADAFACGRYNRGEFADGVCSKLSCPRAIGPSESDSASSGRACFDPRFDIRL